MRKLRAALVKPPGGKEYEEVRRTIGNSLIDPDDLAGEVLKDGDFVIIGMCGCVVDAFGENTVANDW